MRQKKFFTPLPTDPAPLQATTKRIVRFEEVDMMKIMWHGHYPSYLEDARQAVGYKYGLSYEDFYREKVAAPIRKLNIEYIQPLHFGKEYTLEGRLHYSEAAKILYDFSIYAPEGTLCTTGFSVQMLVCATSHELFLTPPPFIQDFLEKWRSGEFTSNSVKDLS